MDRSITVFIAGLLGVFIGMALLYISMRVIFFVTVLLTGRKEKK